MKIPSVARLVKSKRSRILWDSASNPDLKGITAKYIEIPIRADLRVVFNMHTA
jgi:hypothetical protein